MIDFIKKIKVLLFISFFAFGALGLLGCGDSSSDSGGGGGVDSILRASVDSSGLEGDALSAAPETSSDGRYIVFSSDATNLVADDTNGLMDIFLHDAYLGTTIRVNVDSNGTEALDGDSIRPAISSDGRYVVFQSGATNLVLGDGNSLADIFMYDTQDSTTTRVSVDSGETEATGGSSYYPSISSDGRYVVFQATATNLVASDTNGVTDVFLRDTLNTTTTRISVDSSETEAIGGNSVFASISSDGRYVVFYSGATNLVASDTNGNYDIFLRDTLNTTTTRLSVDTSGAQAIGGDSGYPVMSADGRYVAFQSSATNLIADDTNAVADVFLRDTTDDTTIRVSVDSSGAEGTGNSTGSSISSDGRYIAFTSVATDLVANDTNGFYDIFVHDTTDSTTIRVSVDEDGIEATGGDSISPDISGDGNYVVFTSDATNLVLDDNNVVTDIFRTPNQ